MNLILGDWGTSRLRLFRCSGGEVTARHQGPGIGLLREAPAQVLAAALARWRGDGEACRVVLCGMAGARSGLLETPYADCPADAAHWAAQARDSCIDGLHITVTAGLACRRADTMPDVMRGEETQIFGALQTLPALRQDSRRLLLPGTHSKWVELQHGRIVAFHTVVSGELFALLRDHSTLARAGDDDSGEREGFDRGLATAREQRDLLPQLFTARSAQLRGGRSRGWALGYLSGLILGCEVGRMLPAPAAQTITLIGDPGLCARYRQALQAYGADADLLDGDTCVLAGLQAFARNRA